MSDRLLLESDVIEAFRKAPTEGGLITPEDIIRSVETGYDPEDVVNKIIEEQEKEFINNEVAMGDMECSKAIEIVKDGMKR